MQVSLETLLKMKSAQSCSVLDSTFSLCVSCAFAEHILLLSKGWKQGEQKYIVRISGEKYQTLVLTIQGVHTAVYEGPLPLYKQLFYHPLKPLLIGSFQICVTLLSQEKKGFENRVQFKFVARNIPEIYTTPTRSFKFESPMAEDDIFVQRTMKILQLQSESINISLQRLVFSGPFEVDGKCPLGGLAIYEHNGEETSSFGLSPFCSDSEGFHFKNYNDFVTQESTKYVLIVFFAYKRHAHISAAISTRPSPCVGIVIRFSFAKSLHVSLHLRDDGRTETSPLEVTDPRSVCGGRRWVKNVLFDSDQSHTK